MRFFAASMAFAAACGNFCFRLAVRTPALENRAGGCPLPFAGQSAGPCADGAHGCEAASAANGLRGQNRHPDRRGGANGQLLLSGRRGRGAAGGTGGRRGGRLPHPVRRPAQMPSRGAGAWEVHAGSAAGNGPARPLRGRRPSDGGTSQGRNAGTAGGEQLLPRPDGPAPAATEWGPAPGNGP